MNEKELSKNEIYEMDLAILKFLREQLLNNNLGYVNFYDEFINFFDTYIFYFLTYPVEEIKKRIFYNIGVGFIEIKEIEQDFEEIEKKCSKKGIDQITIIIENEDGIKVINEEEYLRNFLEIKITAEGLKEIDLIKDELKKNSGLNFYVAKIKEFFEKINNVKAAAGLTVTFILIITIFLFDIKVSQIIKNIPLLSSIINVEIIEQFEKLNENDEEFKTLKDVLDESGGIKKDSIKNIEVKTGKNSSLNSTENQDGVAGKYKTVINNQEKIFRVTLKDGKQQIIKLAKNNDKYIVVIDSKKVEIPSNNKLKLDDVLNKTLIRNPKAFTGMTGRETAPDSKEKAIEKEIQNKLIDSSINNLQNERFMR